MSYQWTPLLELAQGPSKRRVKDMFENIERPGDIMKKNGTEFYVV